MVPFEGESAVSIAIKHFQDAVPPVRDYDPRIPQALENVVLKATAKDPTNATVMLGKWPLIWVPHQLVGRMNRNCASQGDMVKQRWFRLDPEGLRAKTMRQKPNPKMRLK